MTSTDLPSQKSKVSSRTERQLNKQMVEITRCKISNAILEAKQQHTMQEMNNLNSDDQQQTGWNKVSIGEKWHNKTTIVGTGTKISTSHNCNLKTTPNLSYFHVYQLDPSTIEKDLLFYLINMFPEMTCVKLESNHRILSVWHSQIFGQKVWKILLLVFSSQKRPLRTI